MSKKKFKEMLKNHDIIEVTQLRGLRNIMRVNRHCLIIAKVGDYLVIQGNIWQDKLFTFDTSKYKELTEEFYNPLYLY